MDDIANSTKHQQHSWLIPNHETNRLPDGCSLENDFPIEEKQFSYNYTLPSTSFMHWTESFDNLLEDLDGVSLFRLFLEQNDIAKSLEFLFACRGLKLSVPASDKHTIYKAVKAIYRKYLRGETAVPIDTRIKRSISEKLCHKSGMDHHILDPALEQIENQLRSRWYPMFIQSNLFYQYMESHCATSSLPFHSTFPLNDNISTSIMSSLPPGECRLPSSTSTSTVPLTKQNLVMSSPYRSNSNQQRLAVSPGWKSPEESRILTNSVSSQRRMIRSNSLHQRIPPLPTQPSYLPVSIQDSELHSVSSEAHTDETQSHTGSSLVDSLRMLRSPGAPCRRPSGGPMRSSLTHPITSDEPLSLSHTLGLASSSSAVPPRSSSSSQRPNLGINAPLANNTTTTTITTTTNVPPHLSLLNNTGKERCLAEVDPAAFAKILTDKLQNLILKEENNRFQNNNSSNETSTSLFHQAWAGRLLAAARNDCTADDQQAQTILEEHCSRVWHTPPYKESTSDVIAITTTGGGGTNATGGGTNSGAGILNSGTGPSSIPLGLTVPGEYYHHHSHTTAEHKHIHHHHYHPVSGSSNILGASDASSNIDSGVSLIYDTSSSAGPGNAPTTTGGLSQSYYHQQQQHQHSMSHRPTARTTHINNNNLNNKKTMSTSDYSTSSGTAAKPYPAEEKVLAWMMGSKQLPLSMSPNMIQPTHGLASSSTGMPTGLSSFPPPIGLWDQAHYVYATATLQQQMESSGHFNTTTDPSFLSNAHKMLVGPAAAVVGDPCLSPALSCHMSKSHTFPSGVMDQTTSGQQPHSMQMTSSHQQQQQHRHTPSHNNPHNHPHSHPQTHSHIQIQQHQQHSSNGGSGGGSYGATSGAGDMEDTLSKACLHRGHTSPNTGALTLSDSVVTCYNNNSGGIGGGGGSGVGGPLQSTVTTTTTASAAAGIVGLKQDGLVIGYYLCGDPVPYRSQWHDSQITLAQFKQLVAKRGNFRYFFKTASNEFDTGVVHEEIVSDNAVLPLWEGKVVAKIEKID